ncbi:MAG: hypothetical protein IPM08_17530 [Actinomycetales bacterium]|nr:hypothetical protein [Actinomycetales bacterium]
MPKRIRKYGVPFGLAPFGPLSTTEGEPAGGGSLKVEEKPDAGTEGAKPEGVKADDEWRSKFEGQQKVNRDLETKLNGIRDALKVAAGVDDKKADDSDVIAAVRDELAGLRHENAVEKAARRHGITDDDDLKILAAATDAEAMEILAARLAPRPTKATPRPSRASREPPSRTPHRAGAGGGAVRPHQRHAGHG